jgi:hypothetical protein
VAVVHARGLERRRGRPAQALRGADEVELDQLPWRRRAARSSGACFSAYSL